LLKFTSLYNVSVYFTKTLPKMCTKKVNVKETLFNQSTCGNIGLQTTPNGGTVKLNNN